MNRPTPAPSRDFPPGGEPTPAGADFEPARAVADAVLYEGYLLYPYRRSSPKNRVRWQFGVLAPQEWIEARGPVREGISGSAESWWNQTECLLEGSTRTVVALQIRYLQPVQGECGGADGAFDEALPVEVPAAFSIADLLGSPRAVPLPHTVAGSGDVGRLVLNFTNTGARSPLYRLHARLENTAELDPATPRPEALRSSMVAAHLLLHASEGSWLSMIDPPEWATPAARACRNVRAFPVLAGPPASRALVLSAPIILEDHPRVAPESPGDLFDAAEIDEILSLRTLTLSDDEKAEARSTDRRAAEIIDRVESMPPETMGRLHGTIRSRRIPGRSDDEDTVVVAGAHLGRGSRVCLRPRRRGTDAQDMFLTGRTATIETVLTDVDGTRFLAVALDDDPRVVMGAGPGRLLHFFQDEIEPLDTTGAAR
jgi:hypothetical protein